MRIALLLCFMLLLLSGCYDRYTSNYDKIPELDTRQKAVVASSSMTEEDLARQTAELRKIAEEPEPSYTINAGDMVAVSVYNHPDMAVTTTVTPDGCIGMVFVGQIRIAGLSLNEDSARL